MKQKGNKKSVLAAVISAIFIFIGVLCLFSAVWYVNVYGKVGFDAILYTLFSNVGGAEVSLVYGYLLYAALPAVIVTAALAALLLFNWKRKIFAAVPTGKQTKPPLKKIASGRFAIKRKKDWKKPMIFLKKSRMFLRTTSKCCRYIPNVKFV